MQYRFLFARDPLGQNQIVFSLQTNPLLLISYCFVHYPSASPVFGVTVCLANVDIVRHGTSVISIDIYLYIQRKLPKLK